MTAKRRTHLVVMILFLATLACGRSTGNTEPTGSVPSTINTENPLPNTTSSAEETSWGIIPLFMIQSDPADGWINYTVVIAVENYGGVVAYPNNIKFGDANVLTQEGYTYPVNREFQTLVPIPSKFRSWGGQITFKAAENAHPVAIHSSIFGEINLIGIETTRESAAEANEIYWRSLLNFRNVSFPTDEPNNKFQSIGESIQVADKAKITISQASFVNESENIGFIIDVTLLNLDQGYNTNITLYCYVLDGLGMSWWSLGIDHPLGPAQQVQDKFYLLPIADKTQEPDKYIEKLFANAKLFCTGNIAGVGNFEGTFNLENK